MLVYQAVIYNKYISHWSIIQYIVYSVTGGSMLVTFIQQSLEIKYMQKTTSKYMYYHITFFQQVIEFLVKITEPYPEKLF